MSRNEEKPVPEKEVREKMLEPAPERRIHYPLAPWREDSYEHFEGKDFPALPEEPIAVRKLKEAFPEDFLAFKGHRGEATVLIQPGHWEEIARFLRIDLALEFDLLRDLFGVDDLKTDCRREEFAAAGVSSMRFEVVVLLYSLRHRHELRVRMPLPEVDPRISTVTPVYPIADWFERELWEMYGIQVEGHPNLKRLLTHESFEGHPLRKDYPINRRHILQKPIDL